jgi:hypothetical protein
LPGCSCSLLSLTTGKRKLFVCLPLIGFALCMFLSVALKNQIWLSYAALVGCGFFLQSAAGVFWTIPARLFSAEMAGGARGLSTPWATSAASAALMRWAC